MIIGFLRSPRWKTPVMGFIDDNCIAFDDEDEHKLEFTKIHNEFKKIVEGLLEELMAELGVSDAQFVEACERAEQNPVHKKIVDQIAAVEDFIAFKKLMVKRNQDLNKQAMEMFAKQEEAKKAPASGAQVQEVVAKPEQLSEEEMMKRAVEESEKLKSEEQKAIDEEEEMIRQAIELS